jgi:uncharacterized membrane protein
VRMVGGTGSASCPVAGFGTSSVEILCSATTVLVSLAAVAVVVVNNSTEQSPFLRS